ncbi:hypothetical protein ACE6H2_020887 [Prunus campanulata]
MKEMEHVHHYMINIAGKTEGLLDPLNIDLRRYIIHYGERAAAISDAFIDRPKFSENLGLSQYAKKNLFSKSMAGNRNSPPGQRRVRNPKKRVAIGIKF